MPHNSFLIDIDKMHSHFGVARPDKPTFPDPEHVKMRLNFLLEELMETAEACGFGLALLKNEEDQTLETLFVQREEEPQIDPEKILDGMVDLAVVLFGTADIFGFNTTLKSSKYIDYLPTIFEEAWKRVREANMQKVPGVTKRGFSIDLVKPEGWKAPDLKDLVEEM